MKDAINRVMALVLCTVFSGASLVGCQTTDPTKRSLSAKSSAATRCQRLDDRRKDCEDEVGCYWDYNTDKCTAL